MNHGVYVGEQATSVSTPVVAQTGIPFVVGTAPVQSAENPVKAGVPVLCTSWDDAVDKLGYSENWQKYTLCEFLYSHFKLYGRQPVILCNVLDASKVTAVDAADLAVTDHKAKLPIEAVRTSIVVKSGETELVKDTDYGVYTDGEYVVIEVLPGSDAYTEKTLNVAYNAVAHEVTAADVAEGFQTAELCLTMLGTIPDLFVAPGWSEDPAVAAMMGVKAASTNGVFRGKALVDVDCTGSGAKTLDQAISWKAEKDLTDKDMVVCWPMVVMNDRRFHLSTQLAGLIARVDGDNSGIPYESPSNKNLHCDGLCLADGTEVLMTHVQANQLNAAGITSAINFVNGWVAWGNYTGCFPANADVKDCMLPVSRMIDWVGNSLVKTFWTYLDRPMNRRLVDTIVDSANIWLNGLVGQQYLLGAQVEMIEEENPLEKLMAGIIKLHIRLTPPGPAQEIDFVLEYDADYAASAMLS